MCFPKVNINPAYKEYELEYALNKVQCKGIVISETYKTQNFIEVLSGLCPELDKSQRTGDLKSSRLPFLQSVITIGKNRYKFRNSKKKCSFYT